MRILTLLLSVVTVVSLAGSALQAQTFDEITLGDFSNNAATPTAGGSLAAGVSVVTGTSQSGSADRDHFTFTIAPGDQLTSFLITEFAPSAGNGSFFGLDDTSAFVDGDGLLYSGLLNIPAGAAPVEILGNGGGSFGGSGPLATLGPGDYSFLFNETGAVNANYSAQLTVVSAVPEPTSAVVLFCGLGLFAARRKRR